MLNLLMKPPIKTRLHQVRHSKFQKLSGQSDYGNPQRAMQQKLAKIKLNPRKFPTRKINFVAGMERCDHL